jgi:2-polyprenyl-3-methyl-5-hydroxy-6-metoxy-1,4-benzoquinol methylase
MREGDAYHYFEDINLGLLRLWGDRRNLRVLDVGCGYATTSARIQALGNEVTGIEDSRAACEVASSRLTHVVQSDLQNAGSIDEALGDARFDVLIFADVLEHLAWPLGVLRRYLERLAPGGSVIVSLPNVGLWSVRFAHLFGRWNYEETGVLDRTHLRFFTRSSAQWLLREAGLEVERVTYNPGLLRPFVPLARRVLGGEGKVSTPDPSAILDSTAYRIYLRTVHPLERAIASLWPGMLAFQMIYEARRVS